MPGLDYENRVLPTTGLFRVRVAPRIYGPRFYDGTPGRMLVVCPDCGCDADGLFGDHGGECAADGVACTGPGAR